MATQSKSLRPMVQRVVNKWTITIEEAGAMFHVEMEYQALKRVFAVPPLELSCLLTTLVKFEILDSPVDEAAEYAV